MKKLLLCLLYLSRVFTSDYSDFDSYQGKLCRQQIEKRLKKYLLKDESISSYLVLSDEELTLYNGPDKKVEYRLKLSSTSQKVGFKKRKNLVGVRVAIDPGHLGGSYARIEERFIDIPPSLERAHRIQFDEGTLSFLTAVYLKILLEKEGAIVMITREGIGQAAYTENFFDWLKNHPEHWDRTSTLSKLFNSAYKFLDLRARAEKINAFEPDLTLVIHYNSHHVEEGNSSNNSVTSKNYNMVMIPGAFCQGELKTQEARYEFLRLLVAGGLEESFRLSRSVLKQFTHHLQVPVIAQSDGGHYLNRVALEVKEGIFARNLALTRMVHSPVCYGESLIQNNIDECLNLYRCDFVIAGRKCSSRIKQVAEAYFEGVKDYLLE